jgi:FkbM family methyltransferase
VIEYEVDGERRTMECPDMMVPHLKKVLRGEYEIEGLMFEKPPTILDLGANVGAFAIWASQRWPGCIVHCYEPNPEMIDMLRYNTFQTACYLESVAVSSLPSPTRLHFGRNNPGEASLYDLGEQCSEGVDVDTLSPRLLPPCDIMKIDTEGSEVDIVERAPLPRAAIVLEFHRRGDRILIDRKLTSEGFVLTRADIMRSDRGLLCYVRDSLLPSESL